ncbi:MAG TPA: MarR family transcriptional regulator [Amaricoccus sp.]|nr:MarR family transcriptional regulator [Amaricoccus sp.]
MSKPPPEEATHATTLAIRDHCLCLHVQRAARALARRFDAAFRPLGLTSGQFSLLNALNRPEPPAMGQVAAVLAMDRTTLTAALKPLERRGLVSAVAGEDRRSRRMALTGAGRALLAEAVPVWRRVHAEVDAEVEAAPGGLRGALRALAQGTSR